MINFFSLQNQSKINNIKAICFFYSVFLFILLLSGCGLKSSKEAIIFFKEKVEKDSVTLLDLVSYSRNELTNDTTNVIFVNSIKSDKASISRRGLNGDLLDAVVIDSDDFKISLNNLMNLMGVHYIYFFKNEYTKFQMRPRNFKFKYYELVYFRKGDINNISTQKGYQVFEYNNKPNKASGWIYELYPKWALISP